MRTPVQQDDGGSTLASSLQSMHEQAGLRFQANPAKCYQRHIRELYAETQPRQETIANLDTAVVEQISNEEAKTIILKFEWLRTMGSGTIVCYGLKRASELLGVACFGRVGQHVGWICGLTSDARKTFAIKTAYLMRGACVPYAPKNAASFLIRHSCFLARKDFGWQIFFAYSDHDAGEIGTVYQAANWLYLGTGLGQAAGHYHADYQAPSGEIWSSYKINHDRVNLAKKLGISTKRGEFRKGLIQLGWKQIKRFSHRKGNYVWFEGTPKEKMFLKSECRYPFKPYPKREDRQGPQ
jgi:hypothetical protein